MKTLLALLLMGSLCAVQAQEIKPFLPGSLEQIRADRAEQPFVLGFWSLDCAYCPEELAMLAELRQRHPRLDVVLVATDAPQDRAQLAARLGALGLAQTEAWVFAAAAPEQLRYEIDRRWYGELPRTYLYDASHAAVARSGVLDRAELEQWIEDHVQRD